MSFSDPAVRGQKMTCQSCSFLNSGDIVNYFWETILYFISKIALDECEIIHSESIYNKYRHMEVINVPKVN